MRLLTYIDGAGTRAGVRVDGGVAPTPYPDLLALVRDGEAGLAAASRAAASGEVVRDASPVAPLRPPKLFGSGINYSSHMNEEPGAKVPHEPYFFSKLPSAVIGPGEPIVLPYRGMEVDYEVELAVVIGKAARKVRAEDALGHVFGYTVANDVGTRAIQFRDGQVTLGKSPDTFAPLGPDVVLTDEVPDPVTLHIEAHVNGELRQSESCGNMIFGVATAIAWLTTIITLEPGDVLSMGTPEGCATFRDPPPWLEPGDVVTVSERTIGELTNPVVAGPDYGTPWEAVRTRFAYTG